MQQALVTVPKAVLYENITHRGSETVGEHISDELLSGWTVTIQKQEKNFLKITTYYGYSGWLNEADVRRISSKEALLWQTHAKTIQRMIDVLAAPKVQAFAINTLFMGSAVISWGTPKDGWQKIKTAAGDFGYLPVIALAPPNPKPDTQTELRSAILNYALSYLGTQYRWGGKTHQGIDCSGLTFMSYFMCGILIYRDAAIKKGYPVQEIPSSRLKPADLLYFPGHVALYLGNGKYIHSTGNPRSFGCVINSLLPKDQDYRPDLAENLTAIGSIFC